MSCKPSRYQARYHRFLEYGDGFNSFIEYCRWDADKSRSWNGGISDKESYDQDKAEAYEDADKLWF